MTDAINPQHYKTDSGLEAIDVIEAFFINNHYRATAFKYLARAGKKNPELEIQDLEKARWYIDREIAKLKSEQPLTGLAAVAAAVGKIIDEAIKEPRPEKPERALQPGDQVLVIDGARLDECDNPYVSPSVIGQVGTVTEFDWEGAPGVIFESGLEQYISEKYLLRTWDNTNDIPSEVKVVHDHDGDELYRVGDSDSWTYAKYGVDPDDAEFDDEFYKGRSEAAPYTEVL